MNTQTIIITAVLLIVIGGITKFIIDNFRTQHTIWQYQQGLHFKDGRIVESLKPGRHVFWGCNHTVMAFDGRRQELVVQGQDLITSDKATVKVSAVLLYRISDAERMFASVGEPTMPLHTAVQLAMREVVGDEEIDRFIENKATYGNALAAQIAETADTIGVAIERVEIRDVILGSDLKSVYTGVLRARQEALAEVEKARGEAAALRTMANASRVFENNPALLQMRYFQALEQIAEGTHGNTIIIGKPEDMILGSAKPGT